MSDNDAQTARILRTIATVLGDGRLAALVTDPNLRVDLNMSVKLLDVLSRRASAQAVDVPSHERELNALAQEACELLGISVPLATTGTRLWSAGPMLVGHKSERDRLDDSIYARLSSELASDTDPARRAAARRIFSRFLEIEDAHASRLDPEHGARSFAPDRYTPPTATTPTSRVDAQRLTAYLRHRFPNAGLISASDVRPLVGGFSKDTILFHIDGDAPVAGPAVMRKDVPVHGLRVTAVDEFVLLQRCYHLGVPVPEPLWSESDPTWFDGAFIVVREVTGSNETAWSGDPDSCVRFADQLAHAMARIHAITAADLGVSDQVPTTAMEAELRHIAWIHQLYRTSVDILNPRIEAAFGWLFANVPYAEEAEPSLVHSGLGFHNLMMTDGNLIAILDWEVAHLGDPAGDLAYARQFIERIMPWGRFLACYRRHGGGEYTAEQDRYYAVWRNLRNACSATASIARYLGSDYESVKLPFTGLVNAPNFEMQALRSIAAALQAT